MELKVMARTIYDNERCDDQIISWPLQSFDHLFY